MTERRGIKRALEEDDADTPAKESRTPLYRARRSIQPSDAVNPLEGLGPKEVAVFLAPLRFPDQIPARNAQDIKKLDFWANHALRMYPHTIIPSCADTLKSFMTTRHGASLPFTHNILYHLQHRKDIAEHDTFVTPLRELRQRDPLWQKAVRVAFSGVSFLASKAVALTTATIAPAGKRRKMEETSRAFAGTFVQVPRVREIAKAFRQLLAQRPSPSGVFDHLVLPSDLEKLLHDAGAEPDAYEAVLTELYTTRSVHPIPLEQDRWAIRLGGSSATPNDSGLCSLLSARHRLEARCELLGEELQKLKLALQRNAKCKVSMQRAQIILGTLRSAQGYLNNICQVMQKIEEADSSEKMVACLNQGLLVLETSQKMMGGTEGVQNLMEKVDTAVATQQEIGETLAQTATPSAESKEAMLRELEELEKEMGLAEPEELPPPPVEPPLSGRKTVAATQETPRRLETPGRRLLWTPRGMRSTSTPAATTPAAAQPEEEDIQEERIPQAA